MIKVRSVRERYEIQERCLKERLSSDGEPAVLEEKPAEKPRRVRHDEHGENREELREVHAEGKFPRHKFRIEEGLDHLTPSFSSPAL